MSSEKSVYGEDILRVQNLIEHCFEFYMSRKEAMEVLLDQAKIEPQLTELVWEKLEEENSEFFKAYYFGMSLKHQIMEFNKLIEQHGQLIMHHQIHTAGVASTLTSNGSRMDGHANRMDAPPNMLPTQWSSMSSMHGINGGMIKFESGYSGKCGADGNAMEIRSSIGDASIAAYNGVESNSQPLNGPPLDVDTCSFGLLDQIPQNFSTSDLNNDFSPTSALIESWNFLDLLESYLELPSLGADTDNFQDSCLRELQDNRRSDPTSDCLRPDGLKTK